LTFNITVYNQGSIDATDVIVKDFVPSGMELVDASWNADSTISFGTVVADGIFTMEIDLKIKDDFQGLEIANNAEIISANNALGLTDEDDDLATVHGSSDDLSSVLTDGDIEDERPGSPGTTDNPADVDDYDIARFNVEQEFDLALDKVLSESLFTTKEQWTQQVFKLKITYQPI